ncbi:hypothetical protein [Emcibacter sp.]|nr:hypothetical protein [Emcibacter sp.]
MIKMKVKANPCRNKNRYPQEKAILLLISNFFYVMQQLDIRPQTTV